MQINSIMVVGAGQMGGGIAQVAAQAGLNVFLKDVSWEIVEQRIAFINNLLQRNIEKGLLTEEEKRVALSRIKSSTSLIDASDVDFVIEATPEQLSIKQQIFKVIDDIAPQRAILATNTSSLSITEIAAMTTRPDRVIGMHFMNPVPLMGLVEIIRGISTSDETCSVVQDLAIQLGKTPVQVNDAPGFISNRILMPMINEAIFALQEGVAEAEAIDTVITLGMNHPMGPLALADYIGLDTCLAIMEVLHQGFGDSKYRPCPLLRKMVKAGWLGKKSERGFYSYED